MCGFRFKQHLVKYKRWRVQVQTQTWQHCHITALSSSESDCKVGMIQFHSASYSIFGFTADVNNLGKMERNGSRNVTRIRRYAKNQTVWKWYPVVFSLTNIMQIHWCCLLFGKKNRWKEGQSEKWCQSFRPLVVVKLRRVILAVAAFHGDTTGQDGGHVVSKVIPLLLLSLSLHLPQIETWEDRYSELVCLKTSTFYIPLLTHFNLKAFEYRWSKYMLC